MRLTEADMEKVLYYSGYHQALKDVGEWLDNYEGGYDAETKSTIFVIPDMKLQALKRGEMPKESE